MPPEFPVSTNYFYADLMVGEPRHPLTAKALDHEPAMIQPIAVHDHAAAKEETDPLTRQQIGMKIMVPKAVVGNEGEHVRAQAEIDIQCHAAAPPQPNAGPEHSTGRQGRPTTIAVGLPPADPCGRPIIAGHPKPTQRISAPAAIVESDVSPRVVRLPEPAIRRVNPVSLVAIGPPVGIGRSHRRSPAKPVTGHIHPGPITRKLRLERSEACRLC